MARRLLLATAAVIAVSPAWASGYSDLNTGIAALNREDPGAAIQYLSLAISAPDLPSRFLPVAHFDRGTAYISKGKYEPAIADISFALSQRPDWYDALLLRGGAYDAMHEDQQAASDYASATGVRPDLVQGYISLANVLRHQQKYQEALADDARGIAAQPKSPDVLHGSSKDLRVPATMGIGAERPRSGARRE